jgi:predicted transcriptional regulator
MTASSDVQLIEMTTEIVSAYVAHNEVQTSELGVLLHMLF